MGKNQFDTKEESKIKQLECDELVRQLENFKVSYKGCGAVIQSTISSKAQSKNAKDESDRLSTEIAKLVNEASEFRVSRETVLRYPCNFLKKYS